MLADLDDRTRRPDEQQPADVAAAAALAVEPQAQREPGEQREDDRHRDEDAHVAAGDHQPAEEVRDGDDRQEVDAAVEHAPVLVGAGAEDLPVVAARQGQHGEPDRHREHRHQHVGDVRPGEQRRGHPEAQQVRDHAGTG